MLELKSFGEKLNVAIIGASGGIGGAVVDALSDCPQVERLCAFSRQGSRFDENPGIFSARLDLLNEDSIRSAAALLQETGPLHLVFIATGILHQDGGLQPEKTWSSLDPDAMERALKINTIGPALAAKHFLPLLAKNRKAVFAALSARVGSISDNQLGGWYSYRASKTALNMLLKGFSIELARRNDSALCVGLHPGSVNTELSAPFQRGVPAAKLFSPTTSAQHLLTVIDSLEPADSGKVFAWDGTEIPA